MNNLMKKQETEERISRNFATNPDVWDIVTDECFERMKKYMTKDEIDKAINLRNAKGND